MKYRWDKKYKYWGVTAFLVIAAAVTYTVLLFNLDAVGAAIATLFRVAGGIIYGVVIAYLLSPVVNFLERKCFGRLTARIWKKNPSRGRRVTRGVSTALALLFGGAIVTSLMLLVIPRLIENLGILLGNMSSYLNSAQGWIEDIFSGYPEVEEIVYRVISEIAGSLQNWFNNELLPNVNSIMGAVSSGVVAVVTVVANVFVGIVASIYLLYHKETFIAQTKRIAYSLLPVKWGDVVMKSFSYTHKKIGSFISGQIIDSIIVGIICFIGMLLLGMPYPSLIATVIGVTNIIPFFGPFIGAIPCAFIILLTDPLKALIFLVFILVMQQIDGNIICPKIQGSTTGMSGFWVIFSITVGGGLFGFIGMVLSVPIFAAIYTGITVINTRLLKAKNLPCDTNSYRGEGAVDFQARQPDTENGEKTPGPEESGDAESSGAVAEDAQEEPVPSGERDPETESNEEAGEE